MHALRFQSKISMEKSRKAYLRLYKVLVFYIIAWKKNGTKSVWSPNEGDNNEIVACVVVVVVGGGDRGGCDGTEYDEENFICLRI